MSRDKRSSDDDGSLCVKKARSVQEKDDEEKEVEKRVSKDSVFQYLALIAAQHKTHVKYGGGPSAVLVTPDSILLGVAWKKSKDVDAIQRLLVTFGRECRGCTMYLSGLPEPDVTIKMLAQSGINKLVITAEKPGAEDTQLQLLQKFCFVSSMSVSWSVPDIPTAKQLKAVSPRKSHVPKPVQRLRSTERGISGEKAHNTAMEVVENLLAKGEGSEQEYSFDKVNFKKRYDQLKQDDTYPSLADVHESIKSVNNPVFMAMASAVALWSEDPRTGVGCVILTSDQSMVQGIGWNGFSPGTSVFDQPRYEGEDEKKMKTKYPYVLHAEQNALLFRPVRANFENAVVFTTMFPCNECLPLLVEAKVSKIVTGPYKFKDKKEHLRYFEHLPEVLFGENQPTLSPVLLSGARASQDSSAKRDLGPVMDAE